MTKWYDSDNPSTVVRGGTWRGMVWVLCFVLFVLLVGAIIWFLKVGTADIRGQGNAYQQKESADNRIFQQAFFEDTYQDIKATDAKIATAKQALKRDPDSQIKQTNLTGLQNYCQDAVADYNAQARKYLAGDFRAIDLPAQIDTLDKSTNCK